jgi:hypothetical protein
MTAFNASNMGLTVVFTTMFIFGLISVISFFLIINDYFELATIGGVILLVLGLLGFVIFIKNMIGGR